MKHSIARPELQSEEFVSQLKQQLTFLQHYQTAKVNKTSDPAYAKMNVKSKKNYKTLFGESQKLRTILKNTDSKRP